MKTEFLEVSSDTVSGVLGKSVIMAWTVNTSQSFTAYLYILKNSQRRTTVLFRGKKDQQRTIPKNVEPIFQDRLTVAWTGLTFKLEIKKLQQYDTNNFNFRVITDSSISYNKTIKLTVIKGMYVFLALCLVILCNYLGFFVK